MFFPFKFSCIQALYLRFNFSPDSIWTVTALDLSRVGSEYKSLWHHLPFKSMRTELFYCQAQHVGRSGYEVWGLEASCSCRNKQSTELDLLMTALWLLSALPGTPRVSTLTPVSPSMQCIVCAAAPAQRRYRDRFKRWSRTGSLSRMEWGRGTVDSC